MKESGNLWLPDSFYLPVAEGHQLELSVATRTVSYDKRIPGNGPEEMLLRIGVVK